ncbi:hypothetical protein CA850_05510 [Micromonospora echinospora]|uniref:Uncharacterized protein n=1 Tax=Micromonospora echinospora TaxID=1877 RepID=A0A1C4UZW3_MICEC|nr:hypothetical protein [Micromonospora echinospora]OZV82969.1 hypothetical protein CA850_05510 [Micromonospora echinospora]SCE77263.1 hypothetical protein GA0070618_0814 [Micromonospora echinospora]
MGTSTRTVRPAAPRVAGIPDGEVLREIPLPPYVTGEDAQFAVRAVVVHAPRRWSGGTVCRNDASPHPCRLHRWGRRVLALRGLRPADIDAIVEQGDPAATPPPVA